jgi:hypothetical protein
VQKLPVCNIYIAIHKVPSPETEMDDNDSTEYRQQQKKIHNFTYIVVREYCYVKNESTLCYSYTALHPDT